MDWGPRFGTLLYYFSAIFKNTINFILNNCGTLYHLMRFYDCFIARENFAFSLTAIEELIKEGIRGTTPGVARSASSMLCQ